MPDSGSAGRLALVADSLETMTFQSESSGRGSTLSSVDEDDSNFVETAFVDEDDSNFVVTALGRSSSSVKKSLTKALRWFSEKYSLGAGGRSSFIEKRKGSLPLKKVPWFIIQLRAALGNKLRNWKRKACVDGSVGSIHGEKLCRPLARPLCIEPPDSNGAAPAISIPPPPSKHVEREKYFQEKNSGGRFRFDRAHEGPLTAQPQS